MKQLVMDEGKRVRSLMRAEIASLKQKGQRSSVTLDEWTSTRNHRYMNLNIHAEGARYWNLGLVRVHGSVPAEKCIELLLLYDPHKKRGQYAKWQPTWRGPFLILKRLNASNFVLRKLADRKSFVVHMDRMRAFSAYDSVDRNEVNQSASRSAVPRPSLYSSPDKEKYVKTAVGQRPQSAAQTAAAGDLHSNVCVTDPTSGSTVTCSPAAWRVILYKHTHQRRGCQNS